MMEIETLKQTLADTKEKISFSQKELDDLAEEKEKLNAEIKSAKLKLIETDESVLMQEFGLYTPTFDFAKSDQYKSRLLEIRAEQKDMIKNKAAATGSTNWTVNNSVAKGRKMIADMQKLLIRAFNSECDDVIGKIKFNNVESGIKRITASRDAISKLGDMMGVSIAEKYYKHRALAKMLLLTTCEKRACVQYLKEENNMKKQQQRWQRWMSAALAAVLLLGLPGGMELTAAAAETAQAVVPAVEAAQDAAEQVQEQLSAARAVSYTPEGGTYEICTSDYRLRGAGQRELPRSLDHEYNVGVSIKNHMKRLRKRGAGCRLFDDSPGEDVPFGSLRYFGFIEIVSILIITKRGAPFPAPPAL